MFEWDDEKCKINIEKHGVSFDDATQAFNDPNRIVLFDEGHSQLEDRYFCIGKVPDGILTVRFTIRGDSVRIIRAGFWRNGRKEYEKKNTIH